jgi:hypothetical protein
MRGWLQKSVDEYLNKVAPLGNSLEDRARAEQLATAMRQAWAEQGLSALKQQKNLMTEVRGAIRNRLGENHVALETMNFSTAEWTEVNRATAQRVANQNSNQQVLDPGTVNAVVTRATQLLQSREWAEIAAGLAVLTGRRSTEVLKTAEFTWKTDFSVIFTGALKRKGEEMVLSFEIPTLCQAEYVVSAWEKLRKILRTGELTNAQVNTYSDAVASACDKHFADLVQPTEGRERLYTHLFRKIYATIATYFYCPANVDDAEFRAEIQGHFSGHEHLTLAERRSIASDRHYRSYVIQDEDGNMRKGMRLNWQGVEVIEAFRTGIEREDKTMTESVIETVIEPVEAEVEIVVEASAIDVKAVTEKEERKRSSLRIYSDDHDRWAAVLGAICPDCSNQFDKTSALLEWAEKQLDGVAVPAVAPKKSKQVQLDISAIEHQARTLSWLTGEVESLRDQLAELRGERDELKSQVEGAIADSAVEELRAENEALRRERDWAMAKLDVFRGALNDNSPASIPTVVVAPVAIAPQPKQAKQTVEKTEEKSPTDDSKSVPERALEAIMAYNDRQEKHDDKWVISFPVMKDLCKQLGAATQGKINEVIQMHSAEIEEHHRAHGLGERHNRVHQGASISEFIRL